ncbi:MAG: glycosyltransferase family 4 protein [Candidatus Helarchaeota archaeon]
MKILRISTRIYPDVCGPAKQAFFISKYLSKNGIKVFHITCPPHKNNKKKEKINDNFIIYYLPFKAPGFYANLFHIVIFFIKYFFFTTYLALKIIKKEKIDVIHSHSPPPTGFIAFIMYKLFKIPYFYTIHALDYPIKILFYLDVKISMKNSKVSIGINRENIRFIQNKYNLKNLYWLPNGINTSLYFHVKDINEKKQLIKTQQLNNILDEEDFIISYIGYMLFYQKVKGMIDFLNGFNNFLSELPTNERKKIKLLFIGDGKFSFLLKNRIKELNLEKNVYFLGKRNDIREILAFSDLLGLTSYEEGFPNVILEAMASKIPCLASNTGEIKTILNSYGLIINPGDVNGIKTNLLKYYYISESKKKELTENISKRVFNLFDYNVIGKKLIKLYKFFK